MNSVEALTLPYFTDVISAKDRYDRHVTLGNSFYPPCSAKLHLSEGLSVQLGLPQLFRKDIK